MSVIIPEHWSRVVVANVRPSVEGGRHAAKCIAGDSVVVHADVFCDGHDRPSAALLFKRRSAAEFEEAPMQATGDRFRGQFLVSEIGEYSFTVVGWVDAWKTWRYDLERRLEAEQDVSIDLAIGAEIVARAKPRDAVDRARIGELADALARPGQLDLSARVAIARSAELSELMARWGARHRIARHEPELRVVVEPPLARFSTWYELFPRSCASEPGRHGTFKDVERLLPMIADMGFDVLYLPPIHPIGKTFRKGRNNGPVALPEDVGSPWAIGSSEGGHKELHPELGSWGDFGDLVTAARNRHVEIALDIALQASPDHPYVRLHPEWFRKRPDGAIQYAENPPKKYQDIYPFDFECADFRGLWEELKSIFEFWIEKGIRVFRVDNPHTKPFRFWEWCLADLKLRHPEVLFLAEAFTRPRVLYELAKLGFSQSYTYFPWRTSKWEIVHYFQELDETEVVEFLRPNHWANTPDILTEYLQYGGRPAFMVRLLLAATLAPSYGIYGPPFDLCEHRAIREGSEEYLDSEKYQLRHWTADPSAGLRPFIARINRVRREHAAFQDSFGLHFHDTDNDQLICYSKRSRDGNDVVLCIINLDPFHRHRGWVHLNLRVLGLGFEERFQVQDLLSNAHYVWQGAKNYVDLDPHSLPGHVLRVRRTAKSERNFEYFV